MTGEHKPIYLLADSQLLFAKGEHGFLAALVADHLTSAQVKAAYIGASNGDQPEYYEIFKAAMAAVGIRDTRQIRADFCPQDRAYLEEAELILLAGGDVARGWATMTATGMVDILLARHGEGVVLIGISAGAVQLGLKSLREDPEEGRVYFETLKLVPFLIDCHDEAQDWDRLQNTVLSNRLPVPGIGIPFGAGLIYHGDHSLQPLGKPLVEFASIDANQPLNRNILYPKARES